MTAQSPPWPPLVAGQTYRLRSNTSAFVSPLTGVTQRTARSGAKWEFDVQFTSLDDTRTRAWRGFLAKCQDENLTFYWSPYPLGMPQNYPLGATGGITCDSTAVKCDSTTVKSDSAFTYGAPYVSGASQTGRSLVVGGFASGATLVAGDFVAFDNDLYREMHVLTASVTADSGGNATLSISPEIRRSPSNLAEIYLDGHNASSTHRCACEVTVATPDQAAYSLSGFQATMSFKLVEAIR